MRNPRLRDTDGTPYDPETGERVSGTSAEPLVWRVGFDGELVRSADESLPVYDYWTSPLRGVGLKGDDNLFEDPETMSMLAGSPVVVVEKATPPDDRVVVMTDLALERWAAMSAKIRDVDADDG